MRLLLVLIAVGIPTPALAGEGVSSSRFDVVVSAHADGTLGVSEEIAIERRGGELPPLTRQLWLGSLPGGLVLKQRVTRVRVTGSDGAALAHRVRSYAEWTNVDLLEIPEDGVLHLQYRVVGGALPAGDGRIEIDWQVLGFVWKLPVERLELLVQLPVPAAEGAVEHEVHWFEEGSPGEARHRADQIHYRVRDLAPDTPLGVRVVAPAGEVATGAPLGRELREQLGIPLAAAGLFLLLALVLRFAPPGAAIGVTAVWNVACAVIVAIVIAPATSYWVHEASYRGQVGDTVAQIIADGAIAAYVLGFAVVQLRWLVRGDRSAYYTQLALPVWLGLSLPMFSVDPAYLVLPLLGIPVAIYWTRERVALRFGAGAHRIVEEVTTAGRIEMDALARTLELPRKRLEKILRDQPALPIIPDYQRGVVRSPEAAALERDLGICPSCGGATEIAGTARADCGYCGRSYAASRTAEPSKPVPVIVEALARIGVISAFSAGFFMGLVAVVFVVLELVEGGTVGAALALGALAAVIGAGVAGAIYWFARGFRRGKFLELAKLVLYLGTPLVIPFIAARRLSRRRVLLHFDAYPAKKIANRLENDGELSLERLAEMLETDVGEAAEVARYLASARVIPAVYERAGARLVHEGRYADLAREGSCTTCGGVLAITGGVVTCQHCGATPA